MKNPRIILVAVFALVGLVSVGATTLTDVLNVTCYPNNTIVISNPDPDVYIGGFANDSTRFCHVTYSDDNLKIVISGCSKNEDVLVELTSASPSGVRIGGGTNIMYLLRCNDIDSEGIDMTVVQKFTPILMMTVAPPVTPTADLISSLHSGSYSGPTITNAQVGDLLIWTIDIPVEYTAILVSCSAYAGPTVSTTVMRKLIITDACSEDIDLIEHFTTAHYVVSGVRRIYYTNIYAFKFFDNDLVTIGCDLKLCPSGSSSCLISPCISRRRRSDVSDNDSDYTYGQTSTTYKVLTADEYFASTATKPSATLGLQSAVVVVVFIFHYMRM